MCISKFQRFLEQIIQRNVQRLLNEHSQKFLYSIDWSKTHGKSDNLFILLDRDTVSNFIVPIFDDVKKTGMQIRAKRFPKQRPLSTKASIFTLHEINDLRRRSSVSIQRLFRPYASYTSLDESSTTCNQLYDGAAPSRNRSKLDFPIDNR